MMQRAQTRFKQGILLALFLMLFIGYKVQAQNTPLINAFAHNDYFHKRPLFDALDNGYNHIEADVYLRRGKLIVAHIFPMLRRKKELENMYFKPLFDRINGDTTNVTLPAYPITLMIDIKSGADGTYRKLEVLLDKYKSIISGYEGGKFVERQITVVLSGNKPMKMLKQQGSRLAFIDADLMKAHQDTVSTDIYQMASCKYSRLVKWNGKGEFPEAQRERLCNYVRMAHKNGEKVRLWDSPDNHSVWKELLNCGVDLINTDKLVKLKDFLLNDKNVEGVK
ncbi:MAG: phosphatidylinositol-specific phospholipase C/glycerophosphodiester phosphodiesterase family protein [Mucilaginibacter sp.]|uniref:phosphatidylinositol-specific phospholipase C/glycerophosphodiester phosphodiesterase family protein n=1 Tax=Mucilaginibacter sp. TaxID=1882438 RepID=UPI0032637997